MRWMLLCLLACGGASTPTTPSAPRAKVGDLGIDPANLSAQLPPFIDSIGAGTPSRAFSGYVMVAQHDQVIWSGAYGLADRGKQQIPTANTSFRIGSVTKQFTAAAILRLEQDGKLSVTDKVGKHLPEYPGPGKDVTIHQLLTHTAGIPNYTQELPILLRKAEKFTPAQLLELFWDKPLEFEPGSKFSYSNSGYAVLGVIIERASGQPYATYLQQALFAPAKLERTVVGDAVGVPDRAEGYRLDGNEIVPADPIDMSLPYAAGAIRSTAHDLMRWHRALAGDTVLGAAARAKLYTPALERYAYAWVAQEVLGRPSVWHNGGIDGFGTIYWRVPAADLVVIAWTNVSGIKVDPVGKAAVEAALGGKVKPNELERGTLDPDVVARLSGTYELSADEKKRLVGLKLPQPLIDSITTIELTPGNVGIVLKPNGQSQVELEPLADGSFFDSTHQIKIQFVLPWSGPVAVVKVEQGKLAIDYQRR